MKTAAKPAALQPTAVVPAEQAPKEVTHTIQMEDVQRDTLEVEEQKTVSDREVHTSFSSCLVAVFQILYFKQTLPSRKCC